MTDTTKKAQSRRDVIPVHPAAGLFPMMGPTSSRRSARTSKKRAYPSNCALDPG